MRWETLVRIVSRTSWSSSVLKLAASCLTVGDLVLGWWFPYHQWAQTIFKGPAERWASYKWIGHFSTQQVGAHLHCAVYSTKDTGWLAACRWVLSQELGWPLKISLLDIEYGICYTLQVVTSISLNALYVHQVCLLDCGGMAFWFVQDHHFRWSSVSTVLMGRIVNGILIHWRILVTNVIDLIHQCSPYIHPLVFHLSTFHNVPRSGFFVEACIIRITDHSQSSCYYKNTTLCVIIRSKGNTFLGAWNYLTKQVVFFLFCPQWFIWLSS